MTTISVEKLNNDLIQFSGSDVCYRHLLNKRVLYSEGVRHLAQEAQAYWLIDAIASYFGTSVMRKAIKKDDRLSSLQFWYLNCQNNHGTLTMVAYSGEKPAIIQEISYTDFPLDIISIWAAFDGRYWLLFLPSEY